MLTLLFAAGFCQPYAQLICAPRNECPASTSLSRQHGTALRYAAADAAMMFAAAIPAA